MINYMKNNSQKGQALLFVVVAMTIALTVGVAVTSRTLSSLKRTSNTDTSSRVYSAAEGGIEWFLRQPISVLEALADGDTNGGAECPSGTAGDSSDASACVVEYQPQDDDKIQSKALIRVSEFNFNETTSGNEHYWFIVNPGSVKEVALKDYQSSSYYSGNIDLCWQSQEASQSAVLYYYTYGDSGIREKELVAPTSIVGTVNLSDEANASTGKSGYDSCYTVSIASGTNGIRIKSLYAPAKVAVFASSSFPTQGYRVTSLGQIDNVAEKVKAVKEIQVYRSLPYAPAAFDYAIYSDGAID
jgi:hypothetical protein